MKRSIESRLQNNWKELNEKTIEHFQNADTRLDLRNQRINSIKSFDFMFPARFESIDLSENSISTIPRKIFNQSHNLKNFKADSNNLSVVYFDEFSKIKQLEDLSLSNNLITSIEEPYICSSTLKILNLCNNFISKIQPYTFSSLENLKTLYLSCNRIHFLSPFAFFRNFNLEYLLLDNNNLRILHDDVFASLVALKCLHLQNNRFDVFHQKILMFNKNLKVLNMEKNWLRSLSEFSFSSTRELIFLRLDVTMSISFTIFSKIEKLETLHIEVDSDEPFSIETSCLFSFLTYQSKLSNFKLIMKYMKSCKEILLPMSVHAKEIHIECSNPARTHEITTFLMGEQLKLTHNLRKLVLKGLNNFKVSQWNNNRFPPFYFESLLWLDVAKSKLSSSNVIFNKHFQSLKHLDISYCVAYLNETFAFKNLINLEFLNIEGTYFGNIKMSTFSQNVKLKLLIMRNCSIQQIEDYSFATLKDLDVLNLQNNVICNLNEATFLGLNKTKTKVYV